MSSPNNGLNLNKPVINSFFLFIVFFITIYFPKFGILDLSILGLILGVIFLFLKVETFKVNLSSIYVSYFIFLILIYACLVYLFNIDSNANEFSIIRLFRTLFVFVVFALIFSNVTTTISSFLNIVLIVLLLNSIFIIFQVFFPSSQDLMAILTGYDKGFIPLRGFGLVGGFDGAGLLATTGLILNYLLILYSRKYSYLYFFSLLIFTFSLVFTGRTYMFLSLFVHLIGLLSIYTYGNFKAKVFSLFVVCFSSIGLIIYVLPILVLTINAFGFNFYNFGGQIENYNKSYNIEQTNVYSEIAKMPDTVSDIIFGNASLAMTDFGFLMLWHMFGLVGLVLISFLYIWLLLKVNGRWVMSVSPDTKTLKLFFLFFTLLLILSNFKLLFIFARTFSDLHWILLAYILTLKYKSI